MLQGADILPIEDILVDCPILSLQADEVLVEVGTPNQSFYIVLQGRLRLHQDSPEQDPVGTVEPGEALRDLGILSGQESLYFVVADRPSRLLVLDEDRLLGLIEGSHGFARNFSHFLMEHMRYSNKVAYEKSKFDKKYQRLSKVDEFTGLHNRRWLDEMLTRQILRCTSDGQALSVAMIAIDKFDEFLLEYGEVSSRQALYTVAQTLSSKLRPTDMVARYDKNRFIAVLPNTDIAGAELTATRLRTAVADKKIIVPKECILPPVTISVGIMYMQSFIAADRLIGDVELALHRAFDKGGNWVSE